ncbi:MAG: hypothetical protein AAFX00_09315 [Pseudomonadota bacterium]
MMDDALYHTPEPASAHEIYVAALEGMNRALFVGDSDYVCANAVFPFEVETQTATLSVDCEDMARALVKTHSEAIRDKGVTAYFSLASEATFVDDTCIEGKHTTHILRGTYRVVPPYAGSVRLRLVGGRWHFARSRLSLRDKSWPIGLQDVRPPDGLPFSS